MILGYKSNNLPTQLFLLERLSHLLRVLKLRLVREMRVNAHRRGGVGMAKVLLGGENIHAGAAEDGSAVAAEVVRREDCAGAFALDTSAALNKAS